MVLRDAVAEVSGTFEQLIDCWGLTSQHHNLIMRDAIVEGSNIFDHLH